MFRTRQAPSPTGYLHFGTLRQILFTKLFAMKEDGEMYIRLDDTDRSRLQPEAATSLFKTLSQLKIHYEEGVNLEGRGTQDQFYGLFQSGDYGPYIQSERLHIHHALAQTLIDQKRAYWNYLTPEQKEEQQEFKRATKVAINYYKANQEMYAHENLYLSIKDGLAHPSKPALMYALQRSETVECLDILAGKSTFDLTLEEDFVLIKSDGYPTYHLAHIADDHDMKTTLVIRAKEWYPSLPKHVTMFKDIYNELPEFLHLPVILGETGNKKMSKRDGNVNIQDYIDQGFLPEALLNYIAFLGWSPGTEKELYLSSSDFELDFSNEIDWELVLDNRIQTLLSNLVADFGIENISAASARFSKQKLEWFNKEYIKMMSLAEFAHRSSTFNKQSADINKIHSSEYLAALYLDTQRITTLSEIGKDSQCILDWITPEDNVSKWKKITIEETKSCLNTIAHYITTRYPLLESQQSSLLESVHTKDFEILYRTLVETWEKDIKQWLQDNNLDVGSHLWPLRVCLSGQTQSPSPFELLAILSQEEFEKRIEACV